MGIDTKHPEYTPNRMSEWKLMQDAMAGESSIKMFGVVYLAQPEGFAFKTTDNGAARYTAYKGRAQFPEILAPSVGAMVGIVHDKEIKIELPDALEYLIENIDGKGKPLDAFHRTITRNLLSSGRYGVLADAPENGGDPYLVGYVGERIINWDTDFFVLDESGMRRTEYQWEKVKEYRVLSMVDGVYNHMVDTDGSVVDHTPTGAGNGKLTRVPFTVANGRELSPTIETPPMIGIARPAVAIYQLSADYRLQLFFSGQETLVAINGDAPDAVGAGVVHQMQGSEGVTPDLKYVGPSGVGIDAHERAMDHNRESAVQAGARMLQGEQTNVESGSARKLRFSSETANLKTIALTSCALLERGLKDVAMMLGQNEDEVIVTPPDNLLDQSLTPQEAKALVETWQAGGFSYETLYENLQRGGIGNADRSHIEELALIDGDSPDVEGGDAAV